MLVLWVIMNLEDVCVVGLFGVGSCVCYCLLLVGELDVV